MSEKSGGPDKPSEEAADAVASADAELTDTDSSAGDGSARAVAGEAADAGDESAVEDETVEDKATASAGRAAAGSARAAARRSGVRAGTGERKGTATRPRDVEPEKANVFSRLGRFIREVVAELRKVIWPARNQMVTYTLVVIVFVVFMVALVAGLDLLFAKGVLTIFG